MSNFKFYWTQFGLNNKIFFVSIKEVIWKGNRNKMVGQLNRACIVHWISPCDLHTTLFLLFGSIRQSCSKYVLLSQFCVYLLKSQNLRSMYIYKQIFCCMNVVLINNQQSHRGLVVKCKYLTTVLHSTQIVLFAFNINLKNHNNPDAKLNL